ncbi:E1-E2 ATPase-domain-containing protein [Nemania sp. NC0429]|nr:E1-E2 ATPase-domain-containing protein [Nemania sp. NC0429]
MGADCCGNEKTLPAPPSPPSAGTARDSCCDDSPMTGCDENMSCCAPDNEKCNEECLKSVAATLCAEGVGAHTENHNGCGSDDCCNESQTSFCDAHLQMAFAQYQSFLDDVRCICRSMIKRGFKSCCKPSKAVAGAQGPATAPSGTSSCEAGGKDCCGSSARSSVDVDKKAGCCSTNEANGQQLRCSVRGIGKAKPDSCCDSEQVSDAGHSGKERVDNCCGGSKGSDTCCGGKSLLKDAYLQQEPDDCCGDNEGPDTCCGGKSALNDADLEQGPDGCCGTNHTSREVPGHKDASTECCGEKKTSTCSKDSIRAGCSDGCCGDKADGMPDPCCNIDERCQLASPPIIDRDVAVHTEKGSGEEVRIGVTGMTCNGCSENLARNLAANGVHNIRINYLQGHADFTIDPALDLNAIIAKTQDATGFRITMLGGEESLTVLTSGSQASTALAQIDFDGVEDVIILSKRTVRIQYNSAIIGARELFYKIGDLSVGLAPPQNDQQLASGRKRFTILLAQTIASFVFTIPILVLAWGEVRVEEDTKAIISLVLGSLVQFLAVPVFYKPALKSLILHGVLELDMLVVFAITAAFVYSVVAFGYLISGTPLETGAFFETSSLLISLIMLGRLVASYARIRAVAAVSVRSLQVSNAIVVENGVDLEIDSRLLQFGDVFKVTPHSRIPTDGTIISGASEVDESMITGESLPVTKGSGASVIAGTINGSGTLIVRLTRLPGKNTITDIAKLVEDATSSRPRVQELADRVAGWFLPVVLTIAVVVFIVWSVVGVKLRNQTSGESVATAITYAVAVLAISCPCGIGLAVPMVIVVANGIAARGGVIVKSAECTERSRKVTDVVFDKTGTLTEPDLDVVAEVFFDTDAADARTITKALVGDSQHPVSVTVTKYLGPGTRSSPFVTDVKSIPGAGIEGSMSGLVIRAGNASWTGSEALPEVRTMLNNGMSILMVTRGSAPIAGYGLRTRLRGDAIATISKLRDSGISVHLVSGDQNEAVQAIAAAVGIDRANVVSQQMPQQKQAYVATLMAQPGKVVMFCGDGTNDAVAVAQADIGVQLSDSISSEVTRGAADIVLLSGLGGIPFLIEVSRAAFARIAFNFVWSAIYNVFSILLAAGAFVRVRIPPAYAGAGELVSILPVIIAALTMLLVKLRPN